MNMRLPKSLVDSDPLLSNVTQIDSGVVTAIAEQEWTAEELEQAERQVEQVLMEEAFIEACFEEMLQEEEDRWFHNQVVSTYVPVLYSTQSVDVRYPLASKLNPEAPEFIPRGLAS